MGPSLRQVIGPPGGVCLLVGWEGTAADERRPIPQSIHTPECGDRWVSRPARPSRVSEARMAGSYSASTR